MDDTTGSTDPAREDAGQPDLVATVGSMSQADRLVGLGAAIVLADYLIFDLIMDEYFFARVLLLVAAIAVFAMWLRQSRGDAGWPVPYSGLLWATGMSAGFLGAIEFLTDIRNNVLDNAGDVIGALVLYAGCILMFVGARMANRS